MRVKICRKEVKESHYWLKLVETSGTSNNVLERARDELIKEATELMKIFGSMVEKSK